MKDGFKVGQRVRVHQSAGIKLHDGWMEEIPHDCSDPSQHWESRILGWSEYHDMPLIATRFRGVRAPLADNPCHTEWPYTGKTLDILTEGDDWIQDSDVCINDIIRFKWEDAGDLHYKNGTILTARVLAPHIESGDWYVAFKVPESKGGWEFHLAVNERDFL